MSFLAPALLVALPLAALPIIIHLINQRRFQSIDWAAMKFLLEANRMSRGYARIRQWIILLLRALAVAALIFVISRPLATGLVGLAGGDRADTTLILIDRSASMQQTGAGGGGSKLETGVGQIAQTLESLGESRWVAIDSVSLAPQELESPKSLVEVTASAPAAASADLPALLQAAYDYIKTNQAGQTEVWICSDLQTHDWNAASGRWAALRESFLELPQEVRFHLLAYPDAATNDLAVRVTDLRRTETKEGPALLASLLITRTGGEGKTTVPVHLEVNGARSELAVELEGASATIKDYVIPLADGRKEGWGRVSIPADMNRANNDFFFVFAASAPRQTFVVAGDDAQTRPLELAASISADPTLRGSTVDVDRSQLAAAPWEEAALLLWQSRLPTGKEAEIITSFVNQGGVVLFLPPTAPDDTTFQGVRWTEWTTPEEPTAVDAWRGDQDLLARTASGAALPVGELSIQRYCGLEGEQTTLATLRNGKPLMTRAPTARGGVYFLATTAAVKDSNIASNGVSMYAAIQRALAAGATRLANARQLTAGDAVETSVEWRRLAGPEEALSSEHRWQGGVYAADKRTFAVNRAAGEDQPQVINDEQVAGLFEGLPFDRVDDAAGSGSALTREIWRMFLVGMIGAMVIEAGLSLPKRPRTEGELA